MEKAETFDERKNIWRRHFHLLLADMMADKTDDGLHYTVNFRPLVFAFSTILAAMETERFLDKLERKVKTEE